MRTLFPWLGGKSKVAKRPAALLPEHRCYAEVFAGAASLLFAKEPSKSEVINDIKDELVNLFRTVRRYAREFICELQLITHSRTEFKEYEKQAGLIDIRRAARSWFIMKTGCQISDKFQEKKYPLTVTICGRKPR